MEETERAYILAAGQNVSVSRETAVSCLLWASQSDRKEEISRARSMWIWAYGNTSNLEKPKSNMVVIGRKRFSVEVHIILGAQVEGYYFYFYFTNKRIHKK